VKPPCLRGVWVMPPHCALCPSIHLTTEVKSTENLVRVVKKCQLGRNHYVDTATFRQVIPISLSILASLGTLGRPGSTLGRRRYVMRC
jgi:hypothetical protein